MSGITIQQLSGRIATHRSNMKLPIVTDGFPSLQAEIEDAICRALSPCDQAANCDDGVRIPTSLDWTAVASFLRTMGGWLVKGFAAVPQEEAERRAGICLTCPYNVGVTGCGTCRIALEALRTTLSDATTSRDAGLNNCGVCGCDLKLSVHVPITTLRKGSGNLEYPAWCWKAPGGVAESQL